MSPSLTHLLLMAPKGATWSTLGNPDVGKILLIFKPKVKRDVFSGFYVAITGFCNV